MPPSISKILSIKKESKPLQIQVKDALRKFCEKENSHEYLIKFGLDVEESADQSSMSINDKKVAPEVFEKKE